VSDVDKKQLEQDEETFSFSESDYGSCVMSFSSDDNAREVNDSVEEEM